MLITEEHAKTKWCPFAEHLQPINGVYSLTQRPTDHNGKMLEEVKCLASGCLLWNEMGEITLPDGTETYTGNCALGTYSKTKDDD